MLVQVCVHIRYGYDLWWMVDKPHLKHALLEAAKECHVIRALWSVLESEDDSWLGRNRRDALDYLILLVPLTDDERSDLRAYSNAVLKEKVKDWAIYTMTCVFAIALSVLIFALVNINHSRPIKKKKAMKPKNAKKKEKRSIYHYLLSFTQYVHAMLLDKSTNLCEMISNLPTLLWAEFWQHLTQ